MKLIYVCSPYSGDVKENTERAKEYCRIVITTGNVPYAPHLFFTQFMNDNVPEERTKALKMGLFMINKCDELWVFGERISEGMSAEISEAEKIGIRIIHISSAENTINAIARHYGFESQSNKLIEECAELVQALAKYKTTEKDKTKLRDNIIEELADVWIVMEQIIFLMSAAEEVDKIKRRKISRTLERMKE